MTAPASLCPKCGAAVMARASEGLCPRCLITGVLRRQRLPQIEASEGAAAPAAKLPRLFGDYVLLERLADGGMGVVYRARQVALSREVALKMIRAGALAGAEEVRRFRLEARAAAHLDHPNIVPIYDVGEHEGTLFFTMKLVEGGSLAIRGKAVAPPDPRTCAGLLLKVARAVHHAHQRGILHRDLKPSNILLESNGEPMVADFGLARLTQGGEDFTLAGAVLGTPAFMAPEQAAPRAGELTTTSDVYSLGAVLFFLLTGVPPFRGENHFDTLRRVVEQEAPRPSSLNASVDRDLETICLKCLEKDPARRYGSAEALAADLERWLAQEPILARPITQTERAWKWARRRPALAALLLSTVVGTGSFIALLLASESKLRLERNEVRAQELNARLSAARAADAAQRAELEARRAGSNELSAQLQLYAADIFLASEALAAGNYGLARSALETQIPPPGREDWRGFEWHHLWARSQGSQSHVLQGHSQAVAALTFSHDGRWLISGGRDGRVRFWNMSNREPALVFPNPEAAQGLAEHFSMTPVFTASPETAALMLTGGERYDAILARTRASRMGEVRSVALSPDGHWLAVACRFDFVRVWNMTNQQLAWVLPTSFCRGVAFSADSRRLVVGDGGLDGRIGTAWVKIYDTATHEPVQHIADATGAFAISPDGEMLAVIRSRSRLEIRELSSGRVWHEWAAEMGGGHLAFSPDGTQLASFAPKLNEVVLRTIQDGREVKRLALGSTESWALGFSPDGRTLATGGADHAVTLWTLATNRPLARLHGHGDEVLAVTFSPDNRWVAAAGRDGTVRLWDHSALPRSTASMAARNPAGLSPSGDCVIEDPGNGALHIWSCPSAPRVALPLEPPLTLLGFEADGLTFATLSKERDGRAPALQFWSQTGSRQGEALRLDSIPADWSGCAVAPAAGLLAVASRTGAIALLDWRTGRKLREVVLPEKGSRRIVLSPDGRRGATLMWPRTVQTFDTATGAVLAKWRGSESELAAFAFSPDGQILACGGTDNRVTILDSTTGREVAVLRGHKAEIRALAFSPDGRTLASSSRSLTLKLWHVATWREMATLCDDKSISFLAFSADGATLFAGEGHKGIHRFTAPRTAQTSARPPTAHD